MDSACIYAIQHNKTKRMYIGTTSDLPKRYKGHIVALLKHKHHSKLMQEDFDKFGGDYSVYVLEEFVKPKERIHAYGTIYCSRYAVLEYKWMETYDTINNGYNQQDHIARKHIKNKHLDEFPIKDGIPEMP